MLTRFVRNQLIIFTIASIVGVTVMLFAYMQVPTLLNVGRLTVTLELPAAGGLYRFANVTYRGVQIGKVKSVTLTENGAEAVLSLNTSPKIPADLEANVLSVSAVGEQYVDLRPRTDSGPYLAGRFANFGVRHHDPAAGRPDAGSAQHAGGQHPRRQDLRSARRDVQGVQRCRARLRLAARLRCDTVRATQQRLRRVAQPDRRQRAAAGFAGRDRRLDPDVGAKSGGGHRSARAERSSDTRSLERGPGFAQEVSAAAEPDQADAAGAAGEPHHAWGRSSSRTTRRSSKLLVVFPNALSAQQSFGLGKNNPTGVPISDFSLTISDPVPCTVGFLPPSQWRSPADTTIIDTPDDLYCKLPQDSPIGVRGARNYPCMGHPGKRAPTVELCNDPEGFKPIALRPHSTGPYPFDPNIIAQGFAVDDRVDFQERIYAPLEGTALPPGAVPSGTPPGIPNPLYTPITPAPGGAATTAATSGPLPLPPPPPPGNSVNGVPIPAAPAAAVAPAPAPGTPPVTEVPHGGGVPAAPSAFSGNESDGPSVAAVPYDPNTGQFVTPDGQVQTLTNVAAGDAPKTWKDLLPI